MSTELHILLGRIRAEFERLRHDERGYSTEAVVTTAVLAALALGVLALITLKVMQKANSINL